MGLKVDRSYFKAREVRRQVTGGTGVRQIQSFAQLTSISNNSWISLFSSFKGFLINAGQAIGRMLQFSATQIVQWVLEGVSYLWEFNWDISNEQIDQQIRNMWNAFETRIFGILGRNIGSFAAVGLGGAIAFYMNPLLARLLVTQIADDLFMDLLADMRGLLVQARQSLAVAAFLTTYKNVRGLIKEAYKNPAVKALAMGIGIKEETINAWGDKHVSDWSFAERERKFIDSIDNEQLQNNVEEFIEEAKSGFSETALNMASIWDAMQFQNVPEQKTTLIYQPDRSQSEEFYVHGNSEEILSQVINANTVLEVVEGRDIGNYVVAEDDLPVTKNNGVEIEFVFYNTLDKPWGKENRKSISTCRLKVPNINLTVFAWEKLEQFFKPHAFIDGDHTGEVDLDNGRLIVARGASKIECKEMIKKLASFTSASIVGTPRFGEKDGEETLRWQPRKKRPMYLNHFYVRNYARATKYELLGLRQEAKQNMTTRFDFKSKKKPVNFDYLLREAFKTSIGESQQN